MTLEELRHEIATLDQLVFDRWKALADADVATPPADSPDDFWPPSERVADAIRELSYAEEHLSDALSTLDSIGADD